MKFWNVIKVSTKEYHVVETSYVGEPEYVLARCTGPVPAGEIANAMKLAQSVSNNRDCIYNSVNSIKTAINMFEETINKPVPENTKDSA